MKSIIKRYDIILTVLLFLVMIPAEYLELFSTFENETLSVRHILRKTYGDEEKTRFLSEDIAIIDLNEEFFEEYGGFPFKRSDIGKIISNIALLEPSVIVVDMLFDFNSSYGEDPVLGEYLAANENIVVVSMLDIDKFTKEIKKIRYPINIVRENAVTAYSNRSAQGNMKNRLKVFPELGVTHNQWPVAVMAAAMYLNEKPEIINGQLRIGDRKTTLDQFNDFRIDFPKTVSADV